jgi:very-short-patch-repair endonuclease
VNRSAGAGHLLRGALPDAPWPVAARKLLTNREQSLYRDLLSLYPDHKLFVQVALSRMIDVPENHPERQSIRNRFSQLVADFVLCRGDLSVVAVIELDDCSHERRDRQDADARKTKALADAGLRLVRIPTGDLPSKNKLREIIDGDRTCPGERSEIPRTHTFIAAEPELRLEPDWGSAPTFAPRGDHEGAASRAVKVAVVKMVLGGVVLVFGWVVYTQLVPAVLQRAFQPLTVRHVPPSSTALAAMPTTAVPVVAATSQQESAEKRRSELQAAADLQRQKDHAWLAYYSAPASCEHPVDWKAQVECGNFYIRAKKDFEKAWTAEHGMGQASGPVVVLDNGSIGEVRK